MPEMTGHLRRNTKLGIGLAALMAASAVGWVAGRQIRSPAEIAARTAPPIPSLITAPVEKRKLSSDVVVRGTVRFGLPQVVTLPTSPLKPGKGVVTSPPVKGATVKEGALALSMSGRPVFVLQGAQPAYRDLGPGTTGDDVKQLEAALVRLGFDPGPVDGTYDLSTGLAVAAWYESAGWAPRGPTDEQLLATRTAQTEQFAVQSELAVAREALSTSRGALSTARAKADSARVAARTGATADDAAQAKVDQDKRAAEAEVISRTSALAAAIDAERVAKLQFDAAPAATPALTPAEVAALESAFHAATGSVTTARAMLVAAQGAVAALGGVLPTTSADLARAVVVADAEVNQAADAIPLAQSRVALLESRETATGWTVLTIAARLGTQVPVDEMLFFPTLPLRIDDVTVKAGDEVTGPVMKVSNFQLAVDAALPVDSAKLVRKGEPAAIEQPDLAIHAAGTVTEIADTPGTRGVDAQRFYLEVTPTNAPAALVGASVVVTISVETTDGEVLAVPVAALSVAADGTSRVQVQASNGTTRFVTVKPGLAAKGLVAVIPDGNLVAGDLVVVGIGSNSQQGTATP